MKRSRVAVVTRAAKQMVLDVRKEKLLEEFVMDLIQELGEGKWVVGKMEEAHEHEILELTGEWSREYRKRLKLAREASLVEQDVSNDLRRGKLMMVGLLGAYFERVGSDLQLTYGYGQRSLLSVPSAHPLTIHILPELQY
jgi:hypothetical protein